MKNEIEARLAQSRKLDEAINNFVEQKSGIPRFLDGIDFDARLMASTLVQCALDVKQINSEKGYRCYPAWEDSGRKREDISEELATFAADMIVGYRRSERNLLKRISELESQLRSA